MKTKPMYVGVSLRLSEAAVLSRSRSFPHTLIHDKPLGLPSTACDPAPSGGLIFDVIYIYQMSLPLDPHDCPGTPEYKHMQEEHDGLRTSGILAMPIPLTLWSMRSDHRLEHRQSAVTLKLSSCSSLTMRRLNNSLPPPGAFFFCVLLDIFHDYCEIVNSQEFEENARLVSGDPTWSLGNDSRATLL